MNSIRLQPHSLFFLCIFAVLLGCTGFPHSKKIEDDEKLVLQRYADRFSVHPSSMGPLHHVFLENRGKPLVVFVHGSPGSWSGFAGFLLREELREKYAMLVVDRPGFGKSSGGEPERSVEKQAARILEVVEMYRDSRPVILVGHSFGGPVIARMAMDRPDLVNGLVLVAASIDPSLEETKWFQIPADWWIFRWMIPEPLDVCNQEILALKNELEKMMPLWSEIRVPVTVVHGRQDNLVPFGNVAFAEKMLPAPPEVIAKEEMNHFVPWAYPELIDQGIDRVATALER